ncbi:MAG: hypothetical protein JWR11_4986 [Mycobacterium sp.]|jgi:hypothetical protein|nr:hypothetical protein [Mycobacterium sp.]MDT5178147.1 hypothetical protein [Mycobacterium sp.]
MISLRAIAGGVAIAGALSLAPVGLGSGIGNAEPSPVPPQVTSVHQVGQAADQTPRTPSPSPYAIYGGPGACGALGLAFVNICE